MLKRSVKVLLLGNKDNDLLFLFNVNCLQVVKFGSFKTVWFSCIIKPFYIIDLVSEIPVFSLKYCKIA